MEQHLTIRSPSSMPHQPLQRCSVARNIRKDEKPFYSSKYIYNIYVIYIIYIFKNIRPLFTNSRSCVQRCNAQKPNHTKICKDSTCTIGPRARRPTLPEASASSRGRGGRYVQPNKSKKISKTFGGYKNIL